MLTNAVDAVESSENKSYLLPEISFPLMLPGGYVDKNNRLHRDVVLEPMTGVEEDMIVDEAMAKTGANLRNIIANCLTKIGDYEAPYSGRTAEQRAMFRDIVNNMLVSDKTFLVVALRRISMFEDGDIYKFKLTCDACHKDWTPTLDLRKLRIVPLENPAQRQFSYVLPRSKKVVTYRHLYCYDEPAIADGIGKYPQDRFSVSLAYNIVTLDGKPLASYRDLRTLSSADREALRVEIEKNTACGIDNYIENECPKCHKLMEGNMQLSLPFFIPSALK